MTISTVGLWVVLLFDLFLTFALIRRLNAKSPGKPIIDLPKGTSAPEFAAQTLEGEAVTLATFTGRKLALIFIATYCKPCKELLPKLQTLQERASRGGIELVLVSIEGENVTRQYVQENALTFPVLITDQKTKAFMKDYQVSGTPSFCFITAQGTIYSTGLPHFEGEKWADFEEFLAQEAQLIAARGGATEKVRLQ